MFFAGRSPSLAGPANVILVSSGSRESRYMSGIIFGLLMTGFGLLSPVTASFALSLPLSLIAFISGLGLLPVLNDVLHIAFSRSFRIGVLYSFS